MESWTRRTGETPHEDKPFALTVEGAHGPVLHAVTPVSRAAAVRAGQRATDARAVCPELLLEPHDMGWAARALASLAEWCGRWSPLVAVDGADGLLLDLTGAAHLWGGEEATARRMLREFNQLGHRAQISVAPTVGAAWGLARYAGERCLRVEADAMEAALARLPVEALRLEPGTVLLLGRLGLKIVGALDAVPRLPLARRFTSNDPTRNPLTRLDQALGRLAEPILPHLADPPARALRRAVEPVTDLPRVEAVLDSLAAELVGELERRGRGLRRAALHAYRVDGGVEAAEVETARPTRDPRHFRRLFDGKLDGWDAGFGFDAFSLTALRTDPLGAAQPELLGQATGDAAVARLVDRLVAKLGGSRVRRPVAVESHNPKRSVRWTSALDPVPPFRPLKAEARPVRLLDQPERIEVLYATPEGHPKRFTWRRRPHVVARVAGPERIAPEWWRARAGSRDRDYYRVEDVDGRRYWLFRHGRFGDERDDAPAWYMHGLFA